MKKAFYMKTRKLTVDDMNIVNIDKIGGLPTHKPPYFPKYTSGNYKGFVMQIYCDQNKFPDIDDVLCWQIYSNVHEHGDYEIIEVLNGAKLNTCEGTRIKRLEERRVYYEEGNEPDKLDYDKDDIDDYIVSRIGGSIPEDYQLGDSEFIGWVFESICDYELNFGGRTLILLKNKEGKLEIEFA